MKKYTIRKYSVAWFAVAIWKKMPIILWFAAFFALQYWDNLDGIYR